MDWDEYIEVARQYKKRFSRGAPTILTEEGALQFMRDALAKQDQADEVSPYARAGDPATPDKTFR